MTLEELNEGNSLVKQIIDAENELRELEEWQKIIEKDDEMVWLSSKEKNRSKNKEHLHFAREKGFTTHSGTYRRNQGKVSGKEI